MSRRKERENEVVRRVRKRAAEEDKEIGEGRKTTTKPRCGGADEKKRPGSPPDHLENAKEDVRLGEEKLRRKGEGA